MLVVNYEPKSAPNPSCCSDPSTLCANCATTVLNGREGEWDADDVLPVLTGFEADGSLVNNVPPESSGTRNQSSNDEWDKSDTMEASPSGFEKG